MYIVPLAWLYVALMMAVAEATSSTGTVLGAIITFVLYGALPIGLVVYVLSTPARRRAIKEREQAEWLAQQSAGDATTTIATAAPSTAAASALTAGVASESESESAPAGTRPGTTLIGKVSGARPALEPDAGGKAAADAVAPVRKEP